MHKTLFLILVLFSSTVLAVSDQIQSLIVGAEQGEPWAQLNLGAAYDNGIGGLQEDPVKAVEWYRKSAQQGVAEAQFNLAHCLATGRGSQQNYAESFVWMERAAIQNVPEAQFLLGVMYMDGVGIHSDEKMARKWLEKASKAGIEDAKTVLKRLN